MDGSSLHFSIEYQMHMVVVTASVARLVTTTTFLMSTSDGIRMEDLKSYVMRMVSRKAGRREEDHLQYCRVRLGHWRVTPAPHISDHALLQRSPVVALLTSWFRWRPNGWEFVVSMVFNQLPWKKNGKSDTCDLLVESDASAAKIDPRTLRAGPPQPSHPNKLTFNWAVYPCCCALLCLS